MNWFVEWIDPAFTDNLQFGLILVHVVAALLSMGTGLGGMVTRKGGTLHRQVGLVYFWAMFVTNISAFILLGWRFNLFLLGVTVISFYPAITGYRVIYRKRIKQGHGGNWFDASVAVAAVMVGLALMINSVLGLFGLGGYGIPPSAYGPTVIVILPFAFGLMTAKSGYDDLMLLRKEVTDKNWWWYYHMNAMLSSYIGLTTAFMVQQVGPRMPDGIAWIVWVLPGVIGGVGIAWWIKSYRKLFDAPMRNRQAVA